MSLYLLSGVSAIARRETYSCVLQVFKDRICVLKVFKDRTCILKVFKDRSTYPTDRSKPVPGSQAKH